MRRNKLVSFWINWKRADRELPPPNTEVLVRFRGMNDGYAVLIYDYGTHLWVTSRHEGGNNSLMYSTNEIFAWSNLPKFILGAMGELEESEGRNGERI